MKQLETFDPLCRDLPEEGWLDKKYLEMMAAIENKIDIKDLPDYSELRKLSGCRETISIAEIGGGHRLILRNWEILVPKSLRKQIIRNLHIIHGSDRLMMLNSKRRIFWPKIKKDLRTFYESCPECLEYKQSKAQAKTEISYEYCLRILNLWCKYTQISVNMGARIIW